MLELLGSKVLAAVVSEIQKAKNLLITVDSAYTYEHNERNISVFPNFEIAI
jgi:hypothetical protein